jgi:hypothetical protein
MATHSSQATVEKLADPGKKRKKDRTWSPNVNDDMWELHTKASSRVQNTAKVEPVSTPREEATKEAGASQRVAQISLSKFYKSHSSREGQKSPSEDRKTMSKESVKESDRKVAVPAVSGRTVNPPRARGSAHERDAVDVSKATNDVKASATTHGGMFHDRPRTQHSFVFRLSNSVMFVTLHMLISFQTQVKCFIRRSCF